MSEASNAPSPPPVEPALPVAMRGNRVALGALLLACGALVAGVASPLWVGLMLGSVMAFSAQPIFRWLLPRWRGRRRLCAVATTALTALVVMGCGGLIGYIILREATSVAATVELDFSGAREGWLRGALSRAARLLDMEEAALLSALRERLADASASFAEGLGALLRGVTELLLTTIIGIWTMYYVLVNWPQLAVRLERILPLEPRHTRALIIEFRDVGRSAFVGTVATAIVQGLLGGLGFWIAGVPYALLLGLLIGIASFLPLIGTAAVFLPLGGYYLAQGSTGTGAVVIAWGLLVVVGFADYVVRPRLVGSKNAADPLLMLVALLGGLEVFGVSGLIAGPMAMSLFLAVAHIYESEVADRALDAKSLDAYKRL